MKSKRNIHGEKLHHENHWLTFCLNRTRVFACFPSFRSLARALLFHPASNYSTGKLETGAQMHAGFLIELATDLSFNSRVVPFQTRAELFDSEEFWQISREKLEYWTKTLDIFAADLRKPSNNHNPWTAISCVIEEVLCSDFFVRIAAATCVNKDREFEMNLNAPIGRAVMLFHLEARLRALEVIEIGLNQQVTEAKQLNELRLRLERWCDLLLAFFPNEVSAEFSFESQRNQEFNRDLSEENPSSIRTVERLLRMSIRDYGRKLSQKPAANPTLNRKIAELFSFAEDLPNSVQPGFSPFTSNHINDLTNDAQRWIDDYMTVG